MNTADSALAKAQWRHVKHGVVTESGSESPRSTIRKEIDKMTDNTENPEPESTDTEARPSDLEIVKAIAAAEVGLSMETARWIQGETVEEIREDAKVFARAAAKYLGQRAGGLDGGARGTGSTPESPSFDAQIRAQAIARRSEVNRIASDIDATRRMNGGK